MGKLKNPVKKAEAPHNEDGSHFLTIRANKKFLI